MIVREKEGIASGLIRREVVHICLETFKRHIEFVCIVGDINCRRLCCWLTALRFKLNESTCFRATLPARVIQFSINYWWYFCAGSLQFFGLQAFREMRYLCLLVMCQYHRNRTKGIRL